MEAAAKLVASAALKGRVKEHLDELVRSFARSRELLVREGHMVTVATMLDESGYTEMWQRDKSPEASGRLENLEELVRAMADFETLSSFLDHISLVMENDEAAEGHRVSIMTLQAAKGLEFDTVFLPGWEEGLLPNQRALDEGGVKSLEEERRLAYVGLTRARRRVIISHAANRRIYARSQSSIPSRYIEELPEADIEQTGSAAFARAAQALAATTFTGQFPLMARRARTIEVWEQPERRTNRCNLCRHSRISSKVRLRHRQSGRARQTGCRVRQGGREARVRSVRGEGVTRGRGRIGGDLEATNQSS
jgi:DNA helicase II / ATP-dependent DNA helicase PcrA